ncbi:MAG: 2-oxoacid ferredoxin oxidoreductase [Candidatus Zixiibacteriota bacterium]|nr:MAG: 2-oxoacid ferredoxin oxidoreductase [candidate division Zixibacteria bacterium]
MNNSDDKTRFNTVARPNWCPGCGNFGIQSAVKKALLELDLEPHQVVMTSGIGCSSKIPHWLNVYGLHALHGRSLPVAAGIKLANHELVVIAEGGDGDGFSEGLNHFVQACRRNIDLTYIVHNNGVFSLTTGQASATGEKGFVSSSTPEGAIETALNPVALAIAAGATFVARGFSGNIDQLNDLVVAAVRHRGFAFIDVMQICVTYNPARGYKWYKERVYDVQEGSHDPADRNKALISAVEFDEDRLATGIFYQGDQNPYEESLPQLGTDPLVNQDIEGIDVRSLMAELV